MTLNTILDRCLRNTSFDSPDKIVSYRGSIDSNALFNKYLKVDISDVNNINVPILGRPLFESMITGNDNYRHHNLLDKVVDDMVMHLYVGSTIPKRTTNSILKAIFIDTPYSERLTEIVTPKGEIFYGGKGIMLDKDFNPLFFIEINCKGGRKVYEGYYHYVYTKYICHISPRVFSENTLINKAIMNKIVPHYTTDICSYQPTYEFTFDRPKCEVIIHDFDNKFITPVAPTIDTKDDDLNQALIDNVNDIKLKLGVE